MKKLEFFLEKIYNSGDNASLYFYLIIGALAFILILIIILTSIKPKEKKLKVKELEAKEEIPSIVKTEEIKTEPVLETKEEKPKVLEAKINIEPSIDLIEEPVTIEEKTEKQASSVYLDIKTPVVNEELEQIKEKIEESKVEPILPVEEPKILPQEMDLTAFLQSIRQPVIVEEKVDEQIIKETPSVIDLQLIEKPNIELTEQDKIIEEVTKEEKEIITSPEVVTKAPEKVIITSTEEVTKDELSINPDIFSIEKPTQEKAEDFPKLLSEEDLNVEIKEEIPLEMPKIDFSTLLNEEKREVISTPPIKKEETKEEINTYAPVKVSKEDVKAKLSKLSKLSNLSQKESKDDNVVLDDILKKIGLDDQETEMPALKNEEAIILGR